METNKKKSVIGVRILSAKNDEFVGWTYSSELSPAQRDRLRLKSDDDIELKITGKYEVDVEDAYEQMAQPLLISVRIHGLSEEIFLDLESDDPSLDEDAIDRDLEAKIDWSDFFEDLAGDRGDRAYEDYKDRECERLMHEKESK